MDWDTKLRILAPVLGAGCCVKSREDALCTGHSSMTDELPLVKGNKSIMPDVVESEVDQPLPICEGFLRQTVRISAARPFITFCKCAGEDILTPRLGDFLKGQKVVVDSDLPADLDFERFLLIAAAHYAAK